MRQGHIPRWARWVGVSVVLALVTGCALAPLPPAKGLESGDLKRLGGPWEWSAWRDTPARLGTGPMTVRLREGKLAFETARTSGTLTYHEGDGRRVLSGKGVDKVGGGTFDVALTQWVRASATGSTPATGPMMVLLVVED